jgi:hypothetical protein
VRVGQDLLTEGREHLETWDALSREFNKAQLLWRSQRERYPSLLCTCVSVVSEASE